jgi:hypothetical protein
LDCFGERDHLGRVVRGERGHEVDCGKELKAKVFRVGARGGKLDAESCAAEALVVNSVEQLDGDDDLVAGAALIEPWPRGGR